MTLDPILILQITKTLAPPFRRDRERIITAKRRQQSGSGALAQQ